MTDGISIRDVIAGKYESQSRTISNRRQTLRMVSGLNQVYEVAGNPNLSLNQKTTLLKSIRETHLQPWPNATPEEMEIDQGIAQVAFVSELLAKSAASQSPQRIEKMMPKGRAKEQMALKALFSLFDRWDRMGVYLDLGTAKAHCLEYDIGIRKMNPQMAVRKWFG